MNCYIFHRSSSPELAPITFHNFSFLGACLSSPLAKTLCGISLSAGDNSYIYSTGKFLLVRFKTDFSVTERGFDLTYVLVNSTSSGK